MYAVRITHQKPNSSSSSVVLEEQAELEHLRSEVSRLRTENARLTGSNLNGATVQELHQLELQLNDGLISVKERKDAMLFEEIDRSNHKERELGFEINVLRGEIERLKRFIPQSEQPTQPGFLEYNPVADVPSSSAGLLKQDRLSPDTVCYYGSDNTDSETALQLRGYVGIHSSGFRDFLLKPELLRLSYCVLFSSSYSVSAINLEGQSLDKFLEHYIANNSWVVEKGQAKGQLISLPANEFNHPELKRTQELFRSYRLQEPLDDYCR